MTLPLQLVSCFSLKIIAFSVQKAPSGIRPYSSRMNTYMSTMARTAPARILEAEMYRALVCSASLSRSEIGGSLPRVLDSDARAQGYG